MVGKTNKANDLIKPTFVRICCSVLREHTQKEYKVSSGDSEEETPVPIPNTAVKLFSADGTWDADPWKSRTSLGNIL